MLRLGLKPEIAKARDKKNSAAISGLSNGPSLPSLNC